MIKKTNISILFLLYCWILTAQDYPDPIQLKNPIPGDEVTVSPDVYAFHKYNFLKPNLYTGTVNVTIPIFNIKIGNISVPISLDYSSKGIKVDEYASNVGMGWVLNAGGSVIKVIKDIEDHDYSVGTWSEQDFELGEATYAYFTSKGSLFDCNTYLDTHGAYTPYEELPDVFNQSIISWDFSPCNTPSTNTDASPDLFMVNAPGLSSSFYMTIDDSGNYQPLDNNPKGITYNIVDRTKDFNFNYIGFKRWEIHGPTLLSGNWNIGLLRNNSGTSYAEDYNLFSMTNAHGINYKFGIHSDITESISSYAPSNMTTFNVGSDVQEASVLEADYYNISKNSWYLDEIEDPISGHKVSFSYESYAISKKDTSINFFDDNFIGNLASYNGCFLTATPNYFKPLNGIGQIVSEYDAKRQKSYTKYPRLNRLETINFGEGSIVFHYDNAREDRIGENALTKIEVFDIFNTLIKTIELKQSYFNSKENCTEQECKRLKLDAVVFKDTNGNFVNEYTMDYYHPNSLPKVKSFEQDYLGYYNNNGVSFNNSVLQVPKLYFHENQGRYSILPFPLANVPSQIINMPNDYSIEPNPNIVNYGMLRKINYPTGGYTMLEYEPHKFRLSGHDYISGGARILQQEIGTENGQVYRKQYSYTLEEGNNLSSGHINNLPAYGAIFTYDITQTPSFLSYNKTKSGLELTRGTLVGYSRVIEKQVSISGENIGSTEYNFHSPNVYPNEYADLTNTFVADGTNTYIESCIDYLFNNSGFPYVGYIDNDVKRGTLISKIERDNLGNKIRSESNTYNYSKVGIQEIDLTFKKNIGQLKGLQAFHPEPITFSFDSKINIDRNLITSTNVTNTFSTENKVTNIYYSYDTNYPFIKEQRVVDEVDDIKTNFWYAFDSELNSQPYITDLVTTNRIATPIKQTTTKNNTLTSTDLMIYDSFHDGNSTLILPKSISQSKANLNLEVRGEIIKRDSRGNVLEYITQDGIHHILLWGYRKNYVIAKIEGLSYDILSSAVDLDFIINLSDTDNDHCITGSCNEKLLRDALNDLRIDFQNKAKIITYTYDPLIGMTSITDPRGQTQYYEYDAFNRLKRVKDAQGYIISEHNYHYKSQN